MLLFFFFFFFSLSLSSESSSEVDLDLFFLFFAFLPEDFSSLARDLFSISACAFCCVAAPFLFGAEGDGDGLRVGCFRAKSSLSNTSVIWLMRNFTSFWKTEMNN